MSRDAKLVHTHLFELREHLTGQHELIEHLAAGAHAELDAKRTIRPAPAAPVHELPTPEVERAPVGD